MKLDTRSIKIRDDEFTVTELTVKDLLPLWRSDDDNALTNDSMLRLSVKVNGEFLTDDDFENMPASIYLKLSPLVTEVNTLLFEGDKEGKG